MLLSSQRYNVIVIEKLLHFKKKFIIISSAANFTLPWGLNCTFFYWYFY